MASAAELRQQQMQQVVQAAVGKQKRGEKLLAKELRALEEFERQQDERRGLRFLEHLPKKFWCEWSGRQHRTLDAQAELYGVPLVGKTLDVRQVAKWLHDFLSTHKAALSELVKTADASPGQEKTLQGRLLAEKVEQLRRRNALLADQIDQRRQNLIPRQQVHDLLQRCAGILRGAGERLYRRHGQEAGDMLAHALQDFEQLIAELESHGQP